MKSNDRRKFIRNIGLAGAALATGQNVLASSTEAFRPLSRRTFQPNDAPVRIGLIGAGGMGVEDATTALQVPGVSITAVCDLYRGRIDDAKKRWGNQIFVTNDHKELLKRSDVDMVIIATPDHWHMPITVDALTAGKHVYVEKPMVHNVAEGMQLVDAWKKSGKL
ncbi:MAG TPA: Gfo/Idh/MocA family oxidoreductase, partial [Phnomibacter sp.]|nr:Gfo/Idh/MocA family oxidoreductase [Phnomibacter sp.]